MTNWLISREAVIAAGRQFGVGGVAQERFKTFDRIIADASARVERDTHRDFLPRRAHKLYRYPSSNRGYSWKLWVDQDLLSIETLTVAGRVLDEASYFLEPNQFGPPYDAIEINIGNAAGDVFTSGSGTPQRSIDALGLWGYPLDSEQPAGEVESGLASDVDATSYTCEDASLVDVGDTLHIEDEYLFVSDRALVDTTGTISAALAADKAAQRIGVDSGAKFHVGEALVLDAEQLYCWAIEANDLIVERAWNGSTLAAHDMTTKLYAFRLLTVERGVNGTVAAVHADETAVAKLKPYAAAVGMAQAEALSNLAQTYADWGRAIGSGEGAREFYGTGLQRKWQGFIESNQRMRTGVI